MSLVISQSLLEVLEVERLELDHFWEIHRQQLEQRDQADGSVNGFKIADQKIHDI